MDEAPELLFDGRYRIERELGRGGMGIVYLATDLGLGRKVALKVVAPALASDRSHMARFRREAVALASIRNDHVVRVHAFGVKPVPFFAMELVSGTSLDRILHGHKKEGIWLPLNATLGVVRRIASGLDAAHAIDVVHRDVKPENILIEERTGRPVLIDFGLCGELGPHLGASGGGTPHYMSPEQARWILGTSGGAVTTRADVYALACTAYEALCGRPPFDLSPMNELLRAHVERAAPPPSTWRAELAAFDRVFERALAKAPEERFATAGDLAKALDEASARPPASILPPTRAALPDRGAGIRVLVVDDDESIGRFVGRATQLAFYRQRVSVAICRSGEEAVASAIERMPDLVLLDYAMPGLDGIETLARIREAPNGANARVVVVTAHVTTEQRTRFSLLGVSDFVTKPVSLRALVAKIEEIGKRSGWTRDEEVAEVG